MKFQNILIVFILLLIPFILPEQTFASNHCPSLADKVVSNQSPNSNHKYTGRDCGPHLPSHPTGENVTCVETTGNRYWVYYCAEGCEARYDEKSNTTDPTQDPTPEVCKRPNEAPTTVSRIFGKILPPTPIQRLGFGSTGIGKFLSNLITLIYSLATIVFILMIVWGAWDWLSSGGDKEKLDSARKKLLNAFIGILIFAVAFAVIQVVGQFTGFSFFVGQK